MHSIKASKIDSVASVDENEVKNDKELSEIDKEYDDILDREEISENADPEFNLSGSSIQRGRTPNPRAKRRWRKLKYLVEFTWKIRDHALEKKHFREENAKQLKNHDDKMRFEIGKFFEPFLVNFVNMELTSKNLLVKKN